MEPRPVTIFTLEIGDGLDRRVLGHQQGGGVAPFGVDDADHFERPTGAEGKHVRRIA